MVGGLGRVKVGAPGRELASRSDRESFDDKHGSGTFWAAKRSGLSGGRSDGCGCVRRGIVGEQALTERQESGTAVSGQEAEKSGCEQSREAGRGARSGVGTLANRGAWFSSYFREHNLSSGK